MFYGDYNREKDVEIPDASPEGFEALLRYIYTDEVDITEDNLESVLRLSDKYFLHGLFAECVAWAKQNVKASNVCRFILAARFSNELSEQHANDKKSLYIAWQVVLDHGDDALSSDAFLSLPRELIVEIVGSDELMVNEGMAFLRTVKWAERQLEKNGDPIDPARIRAILGEIMYLIRFPLIDAKEFADSVAESGILTDQECLSLFKWFTAQKKPSLFRVDARCGSGNGKLIDKFGMRLQFDCHHSRQVKTNIETLQAAAVTARPSCRRHAGTGNHWTCLTCYKAFCAVSESCGPFGHSKDTEHGLYYMKGPGYAELLCGLCRHTVASL